MLGKQALLETGSTGSDDPVGDHGGEARGNDSPSLMSNYLAFGTPEVDG
jgi:hypothetical protein